MSDVTNVVLTRVQVAADSLVNDSPMAGDLPDDILRVARGYAASQTEGAIIIVSSDDENVRERVVNETLKAAITARNEAEGSEQVRDVLLISSENEHQSNVTKFVENHPDGASPVSREGGEREQKTRLIVSTAEIVIDHGTMWEALEIPVFGKTNIISLPELSPREIFEKVNLVDRNGKLNYLGLPADVFYDVNIVVYYPDSVDSGVVYNWGNGGQWLQFGA